MRTLVRRLEVTAVTKSHKACLLSWTAFQTCDFLKQNLKTLIDIILQLQ